MSDGLIKSQPAMQLLKMKRTELQHSEQELADVSICPSDEEFAIVHIGMHI